MDIKQKLNTKIKSLAKVPSKLTANLSTGDLPFKPPNFRPQINSLFNANQETRSGLTDLNKNALSPEQIRYIQEKHLPVIAQYAKQKELREMQINPYLTNPKLEQEIINSIEQLYYSDLIESGSEDEQRDKSANRDEPDFASIEESVEATDEQQSAESTDGFDPFEHILNKLPNTMDLGFILEERKRLNKQLMVVTKRVSDLIQQNQSTYNKELTSVIELQEILIDAINICSSGRGKLVVAKQNLTHPNLTLLSNYRRREVMISLLKEFFTIKTLLQTELILNDLITEEEDYAGAIKLCLECLKIIGSLNHYKCLTDLGIKLNGTIEKTEVRLDLALAQLCVHFNPNQFSKIRETFNLLGKKQFVYDQLLIHFSSIIDEKAFKIVNSYVELCVVSLNDSLASSKQSQGERSFEEVCSQLSSDCFLPCLVDFNKSMWHIMVNYKRFISAHDDKETNGNGFNPDDSNQENGESNSDPEKLRQALMPTYMKMYKQDPESVPFRLPIDPRILMIPDYPYVIKKPMDLSTIKKKLDTHQYTDPWQYVDDVWLMFENAWLYNRISSKVYRYCTKLREVFEAEIDQAMQSLGYCCGRRYVLQPEAFCFHCRKWLCEITPDDRYMSYQNDITAPVRITYCIKCFDQQFLDDNVTLDSGVTPQVIPPKNQFECKNDHPDLEPFYECKDCGRKFHQVCVQHLNTISPEGFVCERCYRAKEKQPKECLNSDSQSDEQELDCDLTLIRQKLKYGLAKIWQEIENKLTVLIKNHNLSIYSFDDFISMINIVRRMMRVGCEFSGAEKSDQLEEALKRATSEYFFFYHKTKMEEIKVFLETELWQLVPMKPDFSIEQLHEFNFLKNNLKVNSESLQDPEEECDYFGQIDSKQTPFDRFLEKSEKHDDASVEAGREPEKDKDFKETSVQAKAPDQAPVIVTNSSLNILRIVGKYMQIMIILNQISLDVLLCIFHLFDYYLYGIHVFFAGVEASDTDRSSFVQVSPSLANLLRRIESTLIISKSAKSDARMKFHPPELSNAVNLNDKDRLFGLLERAIGVESLVFLASQLNKIVDPLSSLINEKDKVWLEQFFNQTVNVSVELREPIYMHVAARYIQHEQVVQSMERVNWEVKEIMSQHNLYVDQLIQDLNLFRLKETDLIQFDRKLSSESASQTLWSQMLKLVNFIFIDGFATKKCTPEGRALMQLDYQQFLCKIESVVSIRPIPNKELVDEYIKAYYYTEEQLEKLIKSKRDYTVKQLRSLVSCTLNDHKKGRQRLLALIESEYAAGPK